MVDEDRISGPGPGVSDTGGRKDRDRAHHFGVRYTDFLLSHLVAATKIHVLASFVGTSIRKRTQPKFKQHGLLSVTMAAREVETNIGMPPPCPAKVHRFVRPVTEKDKSSLR